MFKDVVESFFYTKATKMIATHKTWKACITEGLKQHFWNVWSSKIVCHNDWKTTTMTDRMWNKQDGPF